MLTALGLVLCPALGVGQSVPSSLTLADAIALGREHSPAYRQTLNDRSPAAWGARNAYASFLPSVNAQGGIGYTGSGTQNILAQNFSQSVSTWATDYNLGLNWQLSGSTLAQPGLRKAELAAADADIVGAETNLISTTTDQYLTILQARANAAVAQTRVDHDAEFLEFARARFTVGRATLIDVRQAEVARGQAAVALLRASTVVQVEKLRLFQIMGVAPPGDVASVELTDTFSVTAPPWKLEELLTMAEEQNPSLKALRARENAANWAVRAATSSYGPSLSFTAGWSGYSQKLTDVNPAIAANQAQADTNNLVCQYQNAAWLNSGNVPLDCPQIYTFAKAEQQAIRDAQNAYPFHFTTQPFQARLTVSIPIFANFSRPLQVAQAKAQREDLSESVRARGLEVRTQVSQAFLTLGTAYQAIGIQDTSRAAAREQLQLATERYRVGSGTFFELLDAQLAQINGEYEYVNAVYLYHKAVAALEAAVGRPLR
jgi:outer membrane protein